jgi:HrpA-like RNA helicase
VAPRLRVTLMSATLDARLFADYFGRALRFINREPVPVLKVEGKMFPVQEIFLASSDLASVIRSFSTILCELV